jgi:DNA-binding PadR family transcriptional regulator
MLPTSLGRARVSVRYGLLALLDEAPSHGYNLKTAFERRTGGSWALNIGQVYTTIQRLERDGFVESIGEPDDERREYRITPTGREQLAAWFENPVVPEAPARDELTIKVLLAVAAGDVDVTALLQRQRRASIEQLQAYTRRKAKADPVGDVAFLLLIDALIFRTEAEIRWLDAADARIRSLATAAPAATKEADR